MRERVVQTPCRHPMRYELLDMAWAAGGVHAVTRT